jgi:aspartate 1-decarboxylase
MDITKLKSKIHRVTVTGSDLNYEGSIVIDKYLMDGARIFPFEKIDIYNINNGERFSTYALEGLGGSGIVCLNGAAARKVATGDLIIITSYVHVDIENHDSFDPVIVHVDQKNSIIRTYWGNKR